MAGNPFRFGSVIDGKFFTNRNSEIESVTSVLKSENHLVMISPRRFGKTSLLMKVLGRQGYLIKVDDRYRIDDPLFAESPAAGNRVIFDE